MIDKLTFRKKTAKCRWHHEHAVGTQNNVLDTKNTRDRNRLLWWPAFLAFAVFSLITVRDACAVEVPLESVAQVRVDDEGERLDYPAAVYFDPVMEETYLINGGNGRVVVYGPDHFPRMSIGIGRGVVAPRGVTVMDNGEVYLCQVRTAKNPRPRITILNAAFFVDREIFLDKIPEAADFRPKHLVVNDEGLIYLAGDDERGVLVLDQDGNFLRKLQPMDDADLLSRVTEPLITEAETETSEQDQAEASAEEDEYAGIPEEFRPRRTRKEERAAGLVNGKGPVKVNYVTLDSTGRLYLLSAETEKVYVYGPDEQLLFSFGQGGGSPGQLSQPRSLAIDENRQLIYVADYMRHTILAYDMTGKFMFEFGGRGTGPGWFNFPMAIAVNNQGHVLVADLFNKRLQVLDVGYEEALPYLQLVEESEKRFSRDAGERSADADGDQEEGPAQEQGISVETGIEIEQETGAEGQLEEILPAETSLEKSDAPVSTPEPFEVIIEEITIEEDPVVLPDTLPPQGTQDENSVEPEAGDIGN